MIYFHKYWNDYQPLIRISGRYEIPMTVLLISIIRILNH